MPAVEDLALQKPGVALGEYGFIRTDAYQTTSVPGLYAIGDVTGRVQLTPVAIAAGRRLADRLFGGQTDRHLDYETIPTVIFARPPIGTVGLTEQEARERFGSENVTVFRSSFVPLYHALTAAKVRVEMKLVPWGLQQRIVGAARGGRGRRRILQGFAVAGAHGRHQAGLRRHRGDSSDQRGRIRHHALKSALAAAGTLPQRIQHARRRRAHAAPQAEGFRRLLPPASPSLHGTRGPLGPWPSARRPSPSGRRRGRSTPSARAMAPSGIGGMSPERLAEVALMIRSKGTLSMCSKPTPCVTPRSENAAASDPRRAPACGWRLPPRSAQAQRGARMPRVAARPR